MMEPCAHDAATLKDIDATFPVDYLERVEFQIYLCKIQVNNIPELRYYWRLYSILNTANFRLLVDARLK